MGLSDLTMLDSILSANDRTKEIKWIGYDPMRKLNLNYIRYNNRS